MDASLNFDKRVRTIARKNRKIARGHVTYIDAMGVVRKRPARKRVGLPITGLLTLILGFCLFKAVILAHVGGKVYNARVEALFGGTPFEQAGAYVMQLDLVTRFLAGFVGIII